MRISDQRPIEDRAPDIEVLRKERRIEVIAALRRMSKLDRLAIKARYFEGKTYPEIAATLGLTRQGAQLRVARAVDRLGFLLRHQAAGLDDDGGGGAAAR